MRSAVHQYSGIVNEVLGDGILAFFGTPNPREDHAACACLAALAMQEEVRQLGDPELQIRVGLHTGEVVLQAVHATLTSKTAAIGQAVHLASRMEQMADAGRILATSDTYNEARRFIEATHIGARPVKGVSATVDVYEIVGVRNAPASEIFRLQDQLEPLAGRAAQLEQLHAALASTEAGQACVVGLVGEAGIGKSRLCFEFAEECRRRDIFVLEARAAPFGQAMPFQPVLDLLRDYFDIRTAPDAAAPRAIRK